MSSEQERKPRQRGTSNKGRRNRNVFVGGYLDKQAQERFELIGQMLEDELGSTVDNTQLIQYVIKHCPLPEFPRREGG